MYKLYITTDIAKCNASPFYHKWLSSLYIGSYLVWNQVKIGILKNTTTLLLDRHVY